MKKYKKALVLAVGGGNDSVSTVLLQLELNKQFHYKPEHIDIVAVLPDCLEYYNLLKTKHNLISKITENSKRFVGNKEINSFPERVLFNNKNLFEELNIKNIFGLSMEKGSVGILESLKYLLKEDYDLILSIDVGGDFIAHKDNTEVLSPMMDGYMLYALKSLKSYIEEYNKKTDMLFSVFGLGTDGESTPEMLDKALDLLPNVKSYKFNKKNISEFIDFYYGIVEKDRYSRTTDFTIKEILEEPHENPTLFRGRFHTKPNKNEKSKIYYGNFNHFQDKKFFGRYYLFEDISLINNNYSHKSRNGLEWFLKVQTQKTKINHELNGQTYNLEKIINSKNFDKETLFFGTPSRKFNKEQQIEIIKDINNMLINKVVNYAIVYKEYIGYLSNNIKKVELKNDLILISKNEKIFILEKVIKKGNLK